MIFNIKLILSCIYFHFKKKINYNLINSLNFYKNINLKNFLINKFLKKEIGYFKNEKFNDFVVKNLNNVGYAPKNLNIDKPIFHKDALLKAKWTYSKKEIIDGYWSSTRDAQNEMLQTMNKLYDLLKQENILLSIVIYPWPQQLENDKENSKHVQMWKEFCENKCTNFINLFPVFFKEKETNGFLETYKKYYWWNDMHFNVEGNKVVAREISKILK